MEYTLTYFQLMGVHQIKYLMPGRCLTRSFILSTMCNASQSIAMKEKSRHLLELH